MKFFKHSIIAACLIFSAAQSILAQSTGRINFDQSWLFNPGQNSGAQKINFNDKNWLLLDLPHDWSISGKFSKNSLAGANGGALPSGLGWYRKHFTSENSVFGKRLSIEFDGVYKNAQVWINGHYLGIRPYGFSSFIYDLTPYMNPAGQTNLLAVKVDNSTQPNSRWYSGSGIFRHVWLIRNHEVQIQPWRSAIVATILKKNARVNGENWIYNHSKQNHTITETDDLLTPDGKVLSSNHLAFSLAGGDSLKIKTEFQVSGAALWDVNKPNLYKIVSRLNEGKVILDTYSQAFGIRSINFTADSGFYLNGRRLKILGVCDHHDLGCLGAAFNDRAMQRKLEILKSAGVNAIRTSHNPPAPELLDLCDRMGLLVVDEAFDYWQVAKNPYDYHLDYAGWHVRDLSDMVLRDRNHPSIILWSIGNEIPEQRMPEGGKMAAEMAAIVKKYDTTRFVTSACDNIVAADKNGFVDALDVAGINYHIYEYDKQHKQYPLRRFFGSETASALSTRGIYHMPADSTILKTSDLFCSSYDNCVVEWGSSAEAGWKAVKDRDFIAGTFVWTGFDYIGEPTPYDYPAHSSYFGFIDLCGFPKDGFYMYQSQWTAKPIIHLLPHWNWTARQLIDVWAYTNCDEVRLFLNDKPLGVKLFADQEKFHVSWKVPFEPGKLLAVGYKNGHEVVKDSVQTADKAFSISTFADRKTIHSGGQDLSFVTVRVLDKNGIQVPDASNQIHFSVKGAGEVAGVDNGNEISLEPFQASERKAFNGMALVVIKGNHTAGLIQLEASSPGLKSAKLDVSSK